MDRRIIVSLLLLGLLLCNSAAWARMGAVGFGGGASPPSGPVYTDCSEISDSAFYFNADYAVDTKDGCKGVATATDGTLAGSASIVDPTVETPTVINCDLSGSSGGNVFHLAGGGGAADYISFPVTSSDIFLSGEGRVSFNLYLSASTGANQLIRFRDDSNNAITLRANSDNTLSLTYLGNAVDTSVTSTGTVADTTWTNIQIRWSVTNNKVSIKIGAGAWQDDADADAVTAWSAGEPAIIQFGFNTVTNDLYMDDIRIWITSGL